MPKIRANTKCLKDAFFLRWRCMFANLHGTHLGFFVINIFECVHDAMILGVVCFV